MLSGLRKVYQLDPIGRVRTDGPTPTLDDTSVIQAFVQVADKQQSVEKQASGRQPRQHRLQAQGSKLTGKDPIRFLRTILPADQRAGNFISLNERAHHEYGSW
jgi:hypothetical protein